MRTPFQGLMNIIRFNWPFYVISASILIALIYVNVVYLQNIVLSIIVLLAIIQIVASMLTSWLIYDRSNLYSFSWLPLPGKSIGTLVNIHAGFDETSEQLNVILCPDSICVLDFYDPSIHTEASIKRARRRYPSFTGTQPVNSDHLPMVDRSADLVTCIFSLHEIRNKATLHNFLLEVKRILRDEGRFIVTEHVRDWRNFLVYNIGFMHFYPASYWRNAFERAGYKSFQLKK